jgi:hypothetical protein
MRTCRSCEGKFSEDLFALTGYTRKSDGKKTRKNLAKNAPHWNPNGGQKRTQDLGRGKAVSGEKTIASGILRQLAEGEVIHVSRLSMNYPNRLLDCATFVEWRNLLKPGNYTWITTTRLDYSVDGCAGSVTLESA